MLISAIRSLGYDSSIESSFRVILFIKSFKKQEW